jgi:hypothetical protein
MAVEKIVIEVSGKDDLSSTIKDVEKLGAADAANAAIFKKTNQEFQAGLKNTNKAVNSTVESLKSLVPAISAAFAVQSVIAFGKASLNAFIEAERGEKLLLNALGKNEAAFKRLTDAAKKYQATTVYDDDTIVAAQTFLATQGRTEEQINKVIRAATNLSAVTGESLQSSVEKLDATYEGSIGRFGKLDNRLKGLTLTQLENGAAVDLLAEKYAGFAEAELQTTAGKIKQLQNQFGELQESLGESILLGAAPIFKDIASEIGNTNNELSELANKFGLASKEGEQFNVVSFLIKNIIKGLTEPVRALNWVIGELAASYNWLADKVGLAEKKQKSIADLVAENQKVIDAQNKSKEDDVVVTEKQIRTLASLATNIERLKRELGLIQLDTQAYTDKKEELTKAEIEFAKYTQKATDKIKEQKKELDKPTKIDDSLGGTLDVTDYEAKADELKQSAQDVADYESELRAEQRKEIKDQTNFEIAEAERAANDKKQIAQDEADAKKLIEERLIQATMQLMSMAIDFQLAAKQRETDYELNLLQEQYDARTISEEQYNSKRRAILKDQAQAQKEAAIIQATISTANAVIQAYSESAIAGPVLAAIAAAVGIAQIAAISATPIPQFEKGGKIGGKRHKDGGTFIEAEKDEFIINRKAAQKIGFDNLELLNKGIVPAKLLKQGLMEQRNKSFETSMMKIFGSSDFDTYPIEKELRKSRKHDAELTHLLINKLSKGQQKRGNYA